MVGRAGSVLLVRHAQSYGNVERRLSHRDHDPALTPLGRLQARAVAELLAGRGDLHGRPVVCSPSLRTRQTARCVAQALGSRAVVHDERLREIFCGELDGRDDEEAWRTVALMSDRWLRGDLDATYPRGESLRDVLKRVGAALTRVAHLAEDGPVVVVGHGGSLGVYAGQLLPPEERRTFERLANASVSEVQFTVHGARLKVDVVAWNDRRHLGGAPDDGHVASARPTEGPDRASSPLLG